MENESHDLSDEQLDLLAQVVEVRRRAFRQVWFGIAWWSASALALGWSLSSPGSNILWYGGLIGAIFHWVRAVRLYLAAKSFGFSKLVPRDYFSLLVTAAVVLIFMTVVLPETFKVMDPRVGTCWSENSGSSSPTACWSDNAAYQTVALVSSAQDCPIEATQYFDPSEGESLYTCLQKHN